MKNIDRFLVLILGIFLCFTMKLEKVKAANITEVESGYMYERQSYEGEYKSHLSDKFKFYYVEGQVSYCIELLMKPGSPIYEADWEATKLPNEIKEKLILTAYYGYTYPGHQTTAYRAATQGMIWKLLMGEGSWIKYSTDYWGKGRLLDVSSEEAEIERLIASHYIRPSFDGGVYKVQKGQTLTLTDTNNVLTDYKITVSGADYEVNGNKLTIKPIKNGTINVSFEKNAPYSTNYKLFVGDAQQNMIVPGTSDPVEARIRINSFSGSVEGYKTDDETITPQGQATLKGAEYGVYEAATGKLITIVTTDENGYFKSDNILENKEYYLQEIKPSLGYELDRTRYNFDMSDKETIRVDVVEKVIKNYISVLKQYEFVNGNTTFLNAEEGISFEIQYPDGSLFDTIITDENGYASVSLPYGKWKFHQLNTHDGYEKIYDFYINVDENTEKEQYYNILNNALSAYLKVIKVDEETGKTIAIADTTFKIFNIDTNQYVSQFVSGKIISEFKTDENGILVTPLKLAAGNYRLIEVSSPTGYLIDKDGLNFTIGNDTNYDYTTYGAFITITYKNAPIKGKIEIYKTGEDMIISEGEFIYGTKELSGVIFEIYAEEDIMSSDKNHLYFKKGDLVDTITSNEAGYAVSKSLPLGKYYFIEVATNDSYVLDTNKHYFTLKEVDDKTAIVYESYSALNYLKKGTLEFTKTDLITGNVIADTIIEIYTQNNELIFTGKTDINGQIVINDLKIGKYYIVEKQPTTGYILTSEKVYFELKENGEVIKAEMKNMPITSTLKFSKKDSITGNLLPNAVIEIYKDNGELYATAITNENGEIVIDNIPYGKYYIVETQAPMGYMINSEKLYFEIKNDKEEVNVTMIDEPVIITDVPQTYTKGNYVLDIIGFTLCILGILGIGVDLHKKYKKR